MLESIWLFVGVAALLTTGFAALMQAQASRLYARYADPICMVAGVVAALSWWLLAYASLDVQVVGDAVTYSFSMPAVTLWCLMMSVPGLYVAWTGPLEAVKRASSGARPEDV